MKSVSNYKLSKLYKIIKYRNLTDRVDGGGLVHIQYLKCLNTLILYLLYFLGVFCKTVLICMPFYPCLMSVVFITSWRLPKFHRLGNFSKKKDKVQLSKQTLWLKLLLLTLTASFRKLLFLKLLHRRWKQMFKGTVIIQLILQCSTVLGLSLCKMVV